MIAHLIFESFKNSKFEFQEVENNRDAVEILHEKYSLVQAYFLFEEHNSLHSSMHLLT